MSLDPRSAQMGFFDSVDLSLEAKKKLQPPNHLCNDSRLELTLLPLRSKTYSQELITILLSIRTGLGVVSL